MILEIRPVEMLPFDLKKKKKKKKRFNRKRVGKNKLTVFSRF